AMLQHRHLAVEVDGEMGRLLLNADLEVDRAEGERQATERQEQHRLVGRARGEAAVQHHAVVVGHGCILPGAAFPAYSIGRPSWNQLDGLCLWSRHLVQLLYLAASPGGNSMNSAIQRRA